MINFEMLNLEKKFSKSISLNRAFIIPHVHYMHLLLLWEIIFGHQMS